MCGLALCCCVLVWLPWPWLPCVAPAAAVVVLLPLPAFGASAPVGVLGLTVLAVCSRARCCASALVWSCGCSPWPVCCRLSCTCSLLRASLLGGVEVAGVAGGVAMVLLTVQGSAPSVAVLGGYVAWVAPGLLRAVRRVSAAALLRWLRLLLGCGLYGCRHVWLVSLQGWVVCEGVPQ